MGQWYTLLVVKDLEDSFFGFMQMVSFINGCKESASEWLVYNFDPS